MSIINKTLNDINVIKALILENDKQLKADFERIKVQLKKFVDNLSAYDQRVFYIKQLYEIIRALKKHLDFAENQRDTTLLNEVVTKLNCLNDLFSMMKLDLAHKEEENYD